MGWVNGNIKKGFCHSKTYHFGFLGFQGIQAQHNDYTINLLLLKSKLLQDLL